MNNLATDVARGRLLRAVPASAWDTTRLGAYRHWLCNSRGLELPDYAAIWRWSIDNIDEFWQSIIEFFALAVGKPSAILAERRMPGAVWLPGGRMSYPAHVLRYRGEQPALVGYSQTSARQVYSRDELRDAVARCAAGLRRLGVARGDRVAAYVPNIPEAVIAFLATAAVGAIWVSCAPEFGVKAVVDRLSQVSPKVLFAVGGYRYGDKMVDRREQVAAIVGALPALEVVIDVAYAATVPMADMTWAALLAQPAELICESVGFEHPLYILFSSGTTGLPKPIVHGHGGILLEHAKALGLHNDIQDGDVFFWFSTTGWMVWNYGISALLMGATVVCFDGNPLAPDPLLLWRIAAAERVTYFGNSASFFLHCRQTGLEPADAGDLNALRGIGSTGSVLPAEGFEWIATHFPGAVIASASGGTDICSAFVSASPCVPIRAGEIAAPMLGCDVVAVDESGMPVIERSGELIIRQPLPSMPVGFWNDDGSRYRQAYFAERPGIWTHGDWATFFADGACVISGRSDATLNRGGVRLGTSDFYAVAENIPGIADSLVVHIEDVVGGPGELILFLAGSGDSHARAALSAQVRERLKNELSPRHVPDAIVWLNAIPRTLTGKKIEMPVKRLLKGEPIDKVASADSLVNAEALQEILAWCRQSKAQTETQ